MKESSSSELIDKDLHRFFQKLTPNRRLQGRSYAILKKILKSLINSAMREEPITKNDVVNQTGISSNSVYQTFDDWLESGVIKKEGIRKAYRGPFSDS